MIRLPVSRDLSLLEYIWGSLEILGELVDFSP